MKKKRIINFVGDEIFTDGIIAAHDLTSDEVDHEYVIFPEKNGVKFKHIKETSRIRVMKYGEFRSLFEDGDVDAVFLHSLYSCPLRLIPEIPASVKVFWFSWGFDIYQRPLNHPVVTVKLHHPLTSRILEKVSDKKQHNLNPRDLTERFLGRLRYRMRNGKTAAYGKALQRIDYYSGVIPQEYDLVKEASGFKAEPVDYRYINPKTLDLTAWSEITGTDILVGNSANSTCNHVDVLEKLSDIVPDGSQCIVPLSYSGQPSYVAEVVKQGEQLLGKRFHPLVSFMPLEEYTRIIDQCSVAIFLLERQQAMGNINRMIRRGCKVFLSETSVIYRHYQALGVRVFSFQNELTKENLETPLPEEIQKRNREILMEDRDEAGIRKRLQRLYALI